MCSYIALQIIMYAERFGIHISCGRATAWSARSPSSAILAAKAARPFVRRSAKARRAGRGGWRREQQAHEINTCCGGGGGARGIRSFIFRRRRVCCDVVTVATPRRGSFSSSRHRRHPPPPHKCRQPLTRRSVCLLRHRTLSTRRQKTQPWCAAAYTSRDYMYII